MLKNSILILMIFFALNAKGNCTYEAEDATLIGTSLSTSVADYSGSGHISGFDNPGDKVSFSVPVEADGNYDVVIGYAAPYGQKQNYLHVNGTLIESVFFPLTDTFSEVIVSNIALNAGENTIEIVKHWGWFELDYIKVECTPTPTYCIYEAESASLNGTNLSTTVDGFSGTGHVGGFDNADDQVSFDVAVDNAGNYDITIGYAAPYGQKQNYLYVNGTLVESVLFPLTDTFSEVTVSNVALNAGNNSVQIIKYWGWFELDYIKVECTSDSNPNPNNNTCGVGTNFWDLRWGNTYEDIFKPNVDFATTTNPWNPTFLEEVSIYSLFRFMDLVPTNNNQIVNWSDRVSPYSDQEFLHGIYLEEDVIPIAGVAYEWQIDLCNRLQKDMWICIPHKANDEYIQQLATLIKNNLDPSLKCYIEYSNETWNYLFSQAEYCEQQALAMGLPGQDVYEKAFMYQVIGAINIWEIFEQQFGNQMDSRIVKVLAGWQGNPWLTVRHLNILDDTTWNPSQIEPDAYAIGAYSGNYVRGDDPDAISQLIADIEVVKNKNLEVKNIIEPRGYKLLCYEGGQHIADYSSNEGNGSHIANRDAGMYDFYTAWLNANAEVFDEIVHYCHTGQFDTKGSWGAKEYTGQPNSEAHKYRAILDWTNNCSNNQRLASNETINENSSKKIAENQSWFNVHPNPFHDFITINIESEFIDFKHMVMIYNSNGKLVSEESFSNGNSSFNINLNSLASGIYFIQVFNEKESQTQRISKQ